MLSKWFSIHWLWRGVRIMGKPCMVVHTCNPSTHETEGRVMWVPGQPLVHSELQPHHSSPQKRVKGKIPRSRTHHTGELISQISIETVITLVTFGIEERDINYGYFETSFHTSLPMKRNRPNRHQPNLGSHSDFPGNIRTFLLSQWKHFVVEIFFEVGNDGKIEK
jgi:hypothetical protein